MAANLERLAREIKNESFRANRPDWFQSGEAVSQLAKALPLPEEINEPTIEAMTTGIIMENADPTIKQVWTLKREGKNNAEIAKTIDRSIGHVGAVTSFLRGLNLLPSLDNRGRKRGGRNMQRIGTKLDNSRA